MNFSISVRGEQSKFVSNVVVSHLLKSTVAPKLSMLEMKMYSLPWLMYLSNSPELYRAGKTSPWPGGYLHHAVSNEIFCFTN